MFGSIKIHFLLIMKFQTGLSILLFSLILMSCGNNEALEKELADTKVKLEETKGGVSASRLNP
jgi:hypothetical protein